MNNNAYDSDGAEMTKHADGGLVLGRFSMRCARTSAEAVHCCACWAVTWM